MAFHPLVLWIYYYNEVRIMKIEYIHHSGCTIETEDCFLVFDYYKGDIDLKSKKTIVFSSHSHPDHYNPEILKWSNEHNDIIYVLSSDIDVEPKSNIYIMEPYESLRLYDINIRSFSSTDSGLSFLVEAEGRNIFFAGDLNWWIWDEDSEEEKKEMEKAFRGEISKLKGNEIYVAFFPVDPRLRENYSLGGKYFIVELKPKYFIPIHFWNKFSITKDFAKEIDGSQTNVIEIHKNNQIIEI